MENSPQRVCGVITWVAPGDFLMSSPVKRFKLKPVSFLMMDKFNNSGSDGVTGNSTLASA